MAKRKSNRKKKKSRSVKILPISIILFIFLAVCALLIILNKGKVAGYSLVKMETSLEAGNIVSEEEAKKDTMEISVEKKYLSTKSKETTRITVLVNGEEVDLSEIELTSSNEDAIEIEEGIAKAVKVGKSTITATKEDLTATIDLRAILPIKSMTFSAPKETFRVGKPVQMKLIATPSDASIESLKYESSDEKIATVNSNGIVTGVSAGKVTITVIDTYSGIEKSVSVTIKK